MNCEEFELMGLEEDRGTPVLLGAGHGARDVERAAALAHVTTCARCAALQDSWQAARAELKALGEATSAEQTPIRVEMRLRQEFRAHGRKREMRRAGVIAAWALAAAAVWVGIISWRDRVNVQPASGTPQIASTNSSEPSGNTASGTNTEAADNSTDGFTLLPGSIPLGTDDSAIVRVRLQRSALGALGLPVNEERASEWIQVDLLVGEDGQPQAVRLPRSSEASYTAKN